MIMKAAIFTAFALLTGTPLAAQSGNGDVYATSSTAMHTARYEENAAPNRKAEFLPNAVILRPNFAQPGDIRGGHGVNHATELTAIAVYQSVGNRDGVEILSGRLRKLGVSEEQIQRAVENTKLHSGGVAIHHSDRRLSDADIQAGWRASQ